jgi:uncharacterized protein (TIGR02145 family)
LKIFTFTYLIIQFAFVFSSWAQINNTVEIGEQIWMRENLNVSAFRNGDPIPEAQTNSIWEDYTAQRKPAWCYYEMDSTNAGKLGKLYNWFAVNDPRGLAPDGWHVPSDEEWQTLIDYLGGDSLAGGKMKGNDLFWESPNTGATNESGFSALPGGYRYHNGFFYKGCTAFFLSSTEHSTLTVWTRLLNYDNTKVYRYFGNKWEGYSVRLIKD